MHLAPWPHFSSIVSSPCLFSTYSATTEARVLDVHMHEDLAKALVVAFVGLDPAVHLRRGLDLAVASSSSFGSMPQTFSPQTSVNPGNRGANREVLPVLARDFGRAERAGEDRYPSS